MYGTQTCNQCAQGDRMFENDVKMYGTQTAIAREADMDIV